MNFSNYFIPIQKRFTIYIFPPLLIIANYFAFNFFVSLFNKMEGYLSGMIFYWLFFCIIPVLLWVNKRNRKLLFRITKINWWQIILLISPILFAFVISPFRNGVTAAAPSIISFTLLYSLVNAICCEYLWRGLYFSQHQTNIFYAAIVPSVWFGIWQYVPLSIYPASIGNFYFILSMAGMGICWSVVTFYTRSVFWAAISHGLVSMLGFEAVYFLK
ncbi:MAG: CPBP family intramembrane metalloprotease [Bacteroidetes bacterium]|nr:CPBP family intramembrane metalloprotease [Bacteroidota bacterium]MBS1929521.1 CPBP family intramembrane metalloprotease [Bacteroidota bacterium]